MFAEEKHAFIYTLCLYHTIIETIRKEQWQNVVREMPIAIVESVNTMAVNEKVIYIYTCFNGVAIKEWINIYKAVIPFIQQVISKLWYEKIEPVNVKMKGGGKRGRGGATDKVMLLQIIRCFRYMMLINVNISNCKSLKCYI